MEKLPSGSTFLKIKTYATAHKITSGIILVILALVGYWGYQRLTNTSGETHYVTATVEKGTVVASITGTGQVSASSQIDLKPKSAGDITYIGVLNGQEVKTGTLIAQLDARDAQKTVRDAEVNLESARLSYQKLIEPADALSTTQAENALSQATTNLAKAYDDGFNSVSNTFLDLPNVMTGLNDVLYGTTVSKSAGQDNVSAYGDMVKLYDENVLRFKDDAVRKYQAARKVYDQSYIDYRGATRFTDATSTETLINETYDTTKTIAEAVKSANDFLNFVKDRLAEQNKTIPAILVTHQSSLATHTSGTNSHLLDLLSIKNTITSSKYSIIENTQSREKLRAGANTLDVQSSQITIKQRENALRDAQENLANYYVRALFDGTIAKLDVKKGDPVTSGTAVATLITKQQLAEISLNEVDVAKIKVGQKVTLTFDAVEGLNITGKVVEIDTVGTVTQGVVTYGVKIGFDTQDDRVKPGMSTSAAIITDVKQDVLMVPNNAIKTQGTGYYVELFDIPLAQSQGSQGVPSSVAPRQQQVEIGLSNDTSTEIISGLKEGAQVVTRTVTATATQTQQAPSLFGNSRIGR